MDLCIVSKKADTLVNHIMELCEREGATILEFKMAVSRLQLSSANRIEEIEATQPFIAPAPPQTRN